MKAVYKPQELVNLLEPIHYQLLIKGTQLKQLCFEEVRKKIFNKKSPIFGSYRKWSMKLEEKWNSYKERINNKGPIPDWYYRARGYPELYSNTHENKYHEVFTTNEYLTKLLMRTKLLSSAEEIILEEEDIKNIRKGKLLTS